MEVGTADTDAFEQWRARDVHNAIAFARVVSASEAGVAGWAAGGVASALPRRDLLRGAIAAGALLAVGVGGFSAKAYAWSSASARVGEHRTILLPDGSGAKLNTDSKLSWRFRDDKRELWIEHGEVALNLRPGPALVMHGSGEMASLSSGVFNVRLRGGTLDLLVLEGSAQATRFTATVNAPPVIARSGQGLLVPAGDPVVRIASTDQVAATLAWQKGEILFQHEALGSAVEEYNRYLDEKIVVVDRDLAGIVVGGRFTTNDPEPFLRALTIGLGIRVSRSETGYLLTR